LVAHPNSPKPELLHLTSTNTPPEFYKPKNQTQQQIVQVVKWEAPEKSIGGTFANRNNKITETGTHTHKSLRPPPITKQETSKATTELPTKP
jgi:hypothetical protein